ncbi:MAG: Yip1 family protein [Pseudomonadota bacterium]
MHFPLRQLVSEALTVPQAAAKRLNGLDIGRAHLFEAALFVSVTGAIVQSVYMGVLSSSSTQDQAAALMLTPFASVSLLMGQILIVAALVHWVGRMFGGTGTFDGALKLSVFLSFVSVFWSLSFALALMLVPPMFMFLVAMGVVWTLWAHGHFIAQLHGFSSWLRVVAVAFGLSFVLTFVFVLVTGQGQVISR